MVDEETVSGGGSTASICPWCSATYTGERETCPSCGAALFTDPTADSSLPGLTAIDAEAIVRAKTPVARPRNRLLSWISGEYPDQEGAVAEAGALAPPDLAVRREILRLELEAQVANLQAEADALMSEATVDGRLPRVAPVVDELEAVQAGLHQIDEALGETEAEAATEPSPESLQMAAEEAAAEAADDADSAPDDGPRPA